MIMYNYKNGSVTKDKKLKLWKNGIDFVLKNS